MKKNQKGWPYDSFDCFLFVRIIINSHKLAKGLFFLISKNIFNALTDITFKVQEFEDLQNYLPNDPRKLTPPIATLKCSHA